MTQEEEGRVRVSSYARKRTGKREELNKEKEESSINRPVFSRGKVVILSIQKGGGTL